MKDSLHSKNVFSLCPLCGLYFTDLYPRLEFHQWSMPLCPESGPGCPALCLFCLFLTILPFCPPLWAENYLVNMCGVTNKHAKVKEFLF